MSFFVHSPLIHDIIYKNIGCVAWVGRDWTLCVPNVFIFITEKEHDFQTDENIALLHLDRKTKLNLSEFTPQAAQAPAVRWSSCEIRFMVFFSNFFRIFFIWRWHTWVFLWAVPYFDFPQRLVKFKQGMKILGNTAHQWIVYKVIYDPIAFFFPPRLSAHLS